PAFAPPPAAPARAFAAPPPGGPAPAVGAAPPAGGPPARRARAMGLGAGGTMRQEIYRDTRRPKDYRPEADARVFVHLVSAAQWREITGEPAPSTPVTAQSYARHGLPWFDYYDADADDLAPAENLAGVRPTGDWLADEGENSVPDTRHAVSRIGDGRGLDGAWGGDGDRSGSGRRDVGGPAGSFRLHGRGCAADAVRPVRRRPRVRGIDDQADEGQSADGIVR